MYILYGFVVLVGGVDTVGNFCDSRRLDHSLSRGMGRYTEDNPLVDNFGDNYWTYPQGVDKLPTGSFEVFFRQHLGGNL